MVEAISLTGIWERKNMPGRTVAGCWSLRAGVMIVLGLLLVGGGYPVLANDEDATSIGTGVVVDGTPEEGTPPGEPNPDGTDGLETNPPTPTPTPDPSDGKEHDAVAPGTVTVVLWTTDHTPLPERATICIADVCQSGGRARSGVSFWFDDVKEGWQQVTVRVGAPYGEEAIPVLVKSGANSEVEITLVPQQQAPGEKLDPTPRPGLVQQPVATAPLVQGATGATSEPLAVSALPATGTVPQAGQTSLPWVLAGMAIFSSCLAGGMLVVHRRSPAPPANSGWREG